MPRSLSRQLGGVSGVVGLLYSAFSGSSTDSASSLPPSIALSSLLKVALLVVGSWRCYLNLVTFVTVRGLIRSSLSVDSLGL